MCVLWQMTIQLCTYPVLYCIHIFVNSLNRLGCDNGPSCTSKYLPVYVDPPPTHTHSLLHSLLSFYTLIIFSYCVISIFFRFSYSNFCCCTITSTCTALLYLHCLICRLISPLLVVDTFPSEHAYLSCHNKILELGGLGINTVLSMNHPLGVTLHSAQPLFCCRCASCPAYWTSDFMSWKTVPELSVILSLLWIRCCGVVLSLHVQSQTMNMLLDPM